MNNINRIGHLDTVNSVTLNFDNQIMVSKESNSIKVWDIVKGQKLTSLLITDESEILAFESISESLINLFGSNYKGIN